jgi:thiol-disulfide isomerase/thioredoxin
MRARSLLVALVLALTGVLLGASLAGADEPDRVELVLFWGDGCPHCAAEKEWLAEAEERYPHLDVVQYEVWYDEGNRELFERTARDLGFEVSGVPTTVIGQRHWVGWSDVVRQEITAVIELGSEATAEQGTEGRSSSVRIPLVGDVAVSSDSLVFSTLVIGFVDGVNPCSLWVISVLLAIVVRTGSRARVFAVGLTFLTVTAAMYAVYMAGIYSAMAVVSHLPLIQLVVALVAGVFGVVSIKDYFAFRRGISFTISDSAKPGIYRRMRAAASQRDLLPALAATVVLAVGVSLLETPCTAGFPVLWTGLLTAQGVSSGEAAWLFGLYMLPFLVDELIVFGVAVATMRAAKLQERHGRVLKLVAGTMMLALAVTVVVSPEAMSDPLIAILVFAAAFAAAAVIHLVTRRLAPDKAEERTPARRG